MNKYYKKSKELIKQKQYLEAKKLLDEHFPEKDDLNLQFMILYSKVLNLLEEETTAKEFLLSNKKNNSTYYKLLLNQFYLDNDLANFEKYYKVFSKSSPNEKQFYLVDDQLYRLRGSYKSAVKNMEEFINFLGEDATSHHFTLLVEVLLDSGDIEAAEKIIYDKLESDVIFNVPKIPSIYTLGSKDKKDYLLRTLEKLILISGSVDKIINHRNFSVFFTKLINVANHTELTDIYRKKSEFRELLNRLPVKIQLKMKLTGHGSEKEYKENFLSGRLGVVSTLLSQGEYALLENILEDCNDADKEYFEGIISCFPKESELQRPVLAENDYELDQSIVFSPKAINSNKIVIVFSSLAPAFGNFSASFIDHFFAKEGVNAIYIKDMDRTLHLTGIQNFANDVPSAAEKIKDVIANHFTIPDPEILILSFSAGGMAGCIYGKYLQAKKLLAFSPPYTFDHPGERRGIHIMNMLKKTVNPLYFNVKDYLSSFDAIHVYFSENCRGDSIQKELYQKDNTKNLTVNIVKDAGKHNSFEELLARREAVQILSEKLIN